MSEAFLYWGILTVILVSIGTYIWLLSYVEQRQPALWEKLGRPVFINMGTMSVTYWRFLLFLWTGEFRGTHDPKLFALCAATLASNALLVLAILYLLLHGL